jgi:hypothetical protein
VFIIQPYLEVPAHHEVANFDGERGESAVNRRAVAAHKLTHAFESKF